jgi:predicted PurR-regulated permease PerM
MKIYWALFWYTLSFVVLTWGFELMSTSVHEDVHVAIFNNYNINSTVKIDWLTAAGTTSPNSDQYRLYCNDLCKFSHSLNEIIGYNISLISFTIMVGIYILGILLMVFTYLRKLEYSDTFKQEILEELREELNRPEELPELPEEEQYEGPETRYKEDNTKLL